MGVSEPFLGPEKTMVEFGLSVLAVGVLLAMLSLSTLLCSMFPHAGLLLGACSHLGILSHCPIYFGFFPVAMGLSFVAWGWSALWEVSFLAPALPLKPTAPPKGDFASLCPSFTKDELAPVLLAHATTGVHEEVRVTEVSLCFWGSGFDLPAPSLCAFSEGSFQTGSLMHEHPKGVPVPWSPLGPPGFLFQGNICSTVLHGHVSPLPPEPPRETRGKWRCPKEGFPLAGLGIPSSKNTFRED